MGYATRDTSGQSARAIIRAGVRYASTAKRKRYIKPKYGRCPKGHGYCTDDDCHKAARRPGRADAIREGLAV